MIFPDREKAGEELAQALRDLVDPEKNPLIVAIPRGGIAVAYSLAKELKIPATTVVVRKLGLPWNEEAGFGAVDPDGEVYVDEEILRYSRLSPEEVRHIADIQIEEIRKREKKFIPEGYPCFQGRQIFITDDGVATGYTALACAGFLKRKGSSQVIVAVPVCPDRCNLEIREEVDRFVCLHRDSSPAFAVGSFYQDFHQLSDEEVLSYIETLKKEGLWETKL